VRRQSLLEILGIDQRTHESLSLAYTRQTLIGIARLEVGAQSVLQHQVLPRIIYDLGPQSIWVGDPRTGGR
jgi:hypothetical protein